jgi:hypothetical protein
MLNYRSMLEVDKSIWSQTLARKAETYLHQAFGLSWAPQPYHPANLPYFVGDQYTLWRADLLGRSCILMAPRPDAKASVDEIARHVELVRSRSDTPLVILLFEFLSPSRRRALVGRRQAFLVPMAQLFVPEALLELRERTPRPRPKEVSHFSPTAQLVVLGALLEKAGEGASATALAKRYGVAIMSVSRAFDELQAGGVAESHREGQQRSLRFHTSGRALWDGVAERLQSPVRKVRSVVIPYPDRFPGRLAGESALSNYTTLARPRVQRFAVASAHWIQLVRDHGLRETDAGDPERDEVETWTYDPGALARDSVVDPLSLHLSLRDHPDERVAMAADDLLEQLPWS